MLPHPHKQSCYSVHAADSPVTQQQPTEMHISQWLEASTVCAGTNLNLCVWPLTFAEVDRHALRLEQAVVLILGVALGQLRGVARWGLSQRVRQGGRGRRCRGS